MRFRRAKGQEKPALIQFMRRAKGRPRVPRDRLPDHARQGHAKRANLTLGGVGMTTYNDATASPHHPRPREGNRGMGPRHTYTVIDPDTGKIDRGIFSDQAIYDAER